MCGCGQSRSLSKISLFLFKIYLKLLNIREYRESHITREKEILFPFAQRWQSIHVARGLGSHEDAILGSKNTRTYEEFIMKELSGNASPPSLQGNSPWRVGSSLCLASEGQWLNILDQWCSGFVFCFAFFFLAFRLSAWTTYRCQ